jgi:hypothetical protein
MASPKQRGLRSSPQRGWLRLSSAGGFASAKSSGVLFYKVEKAAKQKTKENKTKEMQCF